MKRNLVWTLASLFLLGACAPAGGMEVREAWARPAAQGENGAIYFVIHNAAPTADELTGVSSEVAEAVEMHESRMNGDVMRMHQVKSIPLPAGAETTFEPGGLHVMLIGLKQDLKVGEQIPVTLHFKSAGDRELMIPIQDAP